MLDPLGVTVFVAVVVALLVIVCVGLKVWLDDCDRDLDCVVDGDTETLALCVVLPVTVWLEESV